MSFELNEKIRSLKPYDPITGDYPIRLDANESFLPIGEKERDAIEQAVQDANLRRYPDPSADVLCQAAAAYYGTKTTLLTAWNGLDEAILLLCSAFLGKGETLLTFEMDFSMYHFNAHLAGAACVKLPKRDDFSIDTDVVIDALYEHKPAMLLFSNPCNPTSTVLPRAEIRRILAASEETGTLVALDEAYMDFTAQSMLGRAERYSNLVVLRTCSKAAGLAGLRLGFTVANPELTQALRAVKLPYNVGVLTQAVGEALLGQPLRLQEGIRTIRSNTDALSEGLKALGLQVVGDAANFVFVANLPGAFEYLKERGIIVRCFGDHLRISSGTLEEQAALLSHLDNYLNDRE